MGAGIDVKEGHPPRHYFGAGNCNTITMKTKGKGQLLVGLVMGLAAMTMKLYNGRKDVAIGNINLHPILW